MVKRFSLIVVIVTLLTFVFTFPSFAENPIGEYQNLLKSLYQEAKEGEWGEAQELASKLQTFFENEEKEIKELSPKLYEESEEYLPKIIKYASKKDFEELSEYYEKLTGAFPSSEKKEGFAGLFDSALIILREGFEAFLIIGALWAFLQKAGQENLKGSLILGAVTGVAGSIAVAFFLLSAAGKALPPAALEGLSSIIAAALLFYVSFWLLSKASTHRWEEFIKNTANQALIRKSYWSFFGVSFLAVFREGFETVLFYTALYHQVSPSGFWSGLISGALGLVVLVFAIVKLGVKIPLRPFFLATGILLYYLTIKFAGYGVHELAEIGWISETKLGNFSLSLLGFYPTLENLIVQGILLVIGIYGIGKILTNPPQAT
ncbi:FTR1 family iron permease [Carboxydothermus hydrogenoformans]|uniref:Iron permease, FTR1 family n=1 Tax=Carboxydothermus hydrogenoformans (strain ATCC BAA-161 / DSM 6008 / Z-2901) TaxID=246194 RepID=Q3A9H3_CARHZ|nr:FTR1 family protein [Carboxydothermus hydrogenoformans]ABB14818.1 iron permease, FTR1 family [Carboxydothermus hydrogenoformans Z-2901]